MENTLSNISHGPTSEGVGRLLAGSRVEGIGPVFAHRLVERYGTDAARMLAEKPEEISGIAGLGDARLAAASESLRQSPVPLATLEFLYSCGISDMFIDRIIGKYRRRATEVVLSDPYSMVEDVWQLSFFTADRIGRYLGIEAGDPRRLRGALVTAVKHFAEEGSLFALPEEAVDQAASIAGVEPGEIASQVDALVESGRLERSLGGLYLPVFLKAEKEAAGRLAALARGPVAQMAEDDIPRVSRRGHLYSSAQLEAIRMAVGAPVAVITGGPGSGKTTVLRGVIGALEKEGRRITLVAPTGRAAKRMAALTGHEAMTIHRLLGYRQGEGYDKKSIDTDVIIIDEASMLEQVLFNHLLEALRPGTRVILAGDVDQLPAIGAGNVLRDLIDSGTVPVARLDENFRQAQGSMIAENARLINSGLIPSSASLHDFLIVEESGPKGIHERILRLVAEELPAEKGISPSDILVVTPQQIGQLGARQLNADLQRRLNPEGPELRRGATVFRLGDPVMQRVNSRERDIYNGETGHISAVDTEGGILEVTFADGNTSAYRRSELTELVLAYATSVHKLQGSEARYVVIPLAMAHRPMLYRNLLYTAVSRATGLCVLVGEPEALRHATETLPAATRRSNFATRLRTLLPTSGKSGDDTSGK